MPADYKKLLGKISFYCFKRKMTMSELAVALNYPPDKFIKIEKGKAKIRFSDIVEICNYFEIAPNDLLY